MDAKIVNPFLKSAIAMFATMFRIEATAGVPYLMPKELGHRWEISGIIGITGDYKGIVALRLSRLLADKMLQRSGLALASEDEREDTLFGMIGELVNIVAGNASSELGENVDISPPVVVYGQNHNIAWPRTIPVISLPFTTSLGPFEIAVCFNDRNPLTY